MFNFYPQMKRRVTPQDALRAPLNDGVPVPPPLETPADGRAVLSGDTQNLPGDNAEWLQRPTSIPAPAFEANGAPELTFAPAPQPESIIPAPRLRPSQETMGLINDILSKDYSIKKDNEGNITHRGKDRDTDFDYKDVLGGAGIGALKGLKQRGIIGAIIGAVEGGTDRNTAEKYRDEKALSRYYPRMKMQAEAEKADQQYDENEAQTKLREIQGETAQMDAETAQGRLLLDKYKAAVEGNAWQDVVRNGKYYKKYKDGREEPWIDPETGQQGIELLKQPVKAIVDGQEVWTLGKDVIDRKIAEEYRNAQMAMDADKYNAEELNDYSDKLNKWADDAQDAQNKVTQLKADGQGKLTEADQLETADPYLNAAKIAELRREGASMIRQADEYKMPPKPKPPKGKLSAPKLGGKTVSEAEIQALVQKTGKTEKEIRAMAKRDGYTIQ